MPFDMVSLLNSVVPGGAWKSNFFRFTELASVYRCYAVERPLVVRSAVLLNCSLLRRENDMSEGPRRPRDVFSLSSGSLCQTQSSDTDEKNKNENNNSGGKLTTL
jgi:hypothetical protein